MNNKIRILLMSAFVMLSSTYVIGATGVAMPLESPTVLKKPNPLSLISAKQFLELTPAKFEELSGKKMTWIQKIQFRMLQHRVKKLIRTGQVVTMADVQRKYAGPSSMNVLGFLLGLILGPVGVIVALILKENGDVGPDTMKWSLYGLLIWLVIFLFVILL